MTVSVGVGVIIAIVVIVLIAASSGLDFWTERVRRQTQRERWSNKRTSGRD